MNLRKTTRAERPGSAISARPDPIARPTFVYGLFLALALLLHTVFPARLVRGVQTRAPGVGPIVSGGLLAWAAIRSMDEHGTTVHSTHPAPTLVEHRPFRYSRNPIYVALMLIYASATTLANSRWGMALLPAQFGEQYRAYQARVQRWL